MRALPPRKNENRGRGNSFSVALYILLMLVFTQGCEPEPGGFDRPCDNGRCNEGLVCNEGFCEPAPPVTITTFVGDTCENPLPIFIGDQSVASLENLSDDHSVGCLGIGNDAVFSFSLSEAQGVSIRTEGVDAVLGLFENSECDDALFCAEDQNGDVESGLFIEELDAGEYFVVVKQNGPQNVLGILVETFDCDATTEYLAAAESFVEIETCSTQPATIVFRHLGGGFELEDFQFTGSFALHEIDQIEPLVIGQELEEIPEDLAPGLYALLVSEAIGNGAQRDQGSFRVVRECLGDNDTDGLDDDIPRANGFQSYVLCPQDSDTFRYELFNPGQLLVTLDGLPEADLVLRHENGEERELTKLATGGVVIFQSEILAVGNYTISIASPEVFAEGARYRININEDEPPNLVCELAQNVATQSSLALEIENASQNGELSEICGEQNIWNSAFYRFSLGEPGGVVVGAEPNFGFFGESTKISVYEDDETCSNFENDTPLGCLSLLRDEASLNLNDLAAGNYILVLSSTDEVFVRASIDFFPGGFGVPENDTCAISLGEEPVSFSMRFATNTLSNDCAGVQTLGGDVFYRYVPEGPLDTRFSLASDFRLQTALRLYEDTQLCPLDINALVPLEGGAPACLGDTTKTIDVPLLDRPVLIAVDSFSGRNWNGTIDVSRFENGFPSTEACGVAEEWALPEQGQPLNYSFNTTGRRNESSCVSGVGRGPEIMRILRPDEDMRVIIESSGFDTVLYIQRDNLGACGAQSELFCNDDGGPGTGSLIQIDLRAGETYHLFIDGFGNSSEGEGNVELTRVLVP